MANSYEDHDWIQRVKSEGTLPHIEQDNCPNSWATTPGNAFMVRGPDYFRTKAKVPGGECLLRTLGCDWIKGPTKISGLLNNPRNRVRRAIEDHFPKDCKPFVWAFNIQVPTKENFSVVTYFVAMEPIPEGSLMDQFLKGDDAFRNSRLKLITNVIKGPWIVKKTIRQQGICNIGRLLKCKYRATENFMEVDIDVGSSMVANAIFHVAFGYMSTLTVDIAFLIEGQNESELPERILGALRFSELNATSARSVASPSDGCTSNLPSSQPTLWETLGQGFSNLIHPGAQKTGPVSGSSPANGMVDDD